MATRRTCLSLVISVVSLMAVKGIIPRSTELVAVPHDEDVLECTPTMQSPPFNWDRGALWGATQARVIVDIGGNVGDDVQSFLEHHQGSRVFTFEPTPTYFAALKERFGNNSRVKITNVGASDYDGETEFIVEGKHGEGSTALDTTVEGTKIKVQLGDIDEILTKITDDVGFVPDAVNINCEGCEYAVMQRMADQGWFGKIPFIQLSWHTPAGVVDRVAKRCKIEEALLQHKYERTYKSYPGWVGWKLQA